MLLIDQTNSSPTIQASDANAECFVTAFGTHTLFPQDVESPQYDDMAHTDASLSDLALDISAPYISVTVQSSDSSDSDDDDSYGTDYELKVEKDVNDDDDDDDDPSLVLARNNLSASFSKWECDPEDSASVDDTSMSSDSASKSDKKRVRFAVDPSDSKMVLCRNHTNSNIITRKELSRCWYRLSEIKKFRTASHAEALCARTLSSYKEEFQQLYACCDNSVALRAIPQKHAATVAASQYRGYEALTFIELLRTDRKLITQRVLQTQEEFRRGDMCTSDQLVSLLGSVSQQCSKRSRRLAYVMGNGDAEVARALITSKELEFIMTSTRKRHIVRTPTKCEI
jgi:hypothetical protein